MRSRRNLLRLLCNTAVVALCGAAISDAMARRAIPPLSAYEPDGKSAGYTAKSKTTERCLNCKNYTALPDYPNTGICAKIQAKRVNAEGVCIKFYSPK